MYLRGRRQVFVTPLTSGSVHQATSVGGATISVLPKLLLKAFSKNKKSFKTFTLRNLLPPTTVPGLKEEIKDQLQSDVTQDFDVGYYDNSTQISIRTTHDLTELWSDISKGKKVVMWCDGLREKRNLEFDEQDSAHPPKKRKSKHVEEKSDSKAEEMVHSLREIHGKSFTPMQYRIWAEMVAGGLHESLEHPPNTSMFCRAGNTENKKKSAEGTLTEALTVVADKISCALSPAATTPTRSAGSTNKPSPAKLIENRSKCYRQLSELNSLKSSGVLTEEEYVTEKDAVMETLKNLAQ